MGAFLRAGSAIALAIAMSAMPALANEPSGKTIAVIQSANIDGTTGVKVLEVEAAIFSGDRIETGPEGEAQIRFRDDTKLVVGPNSSMTIDAFVFDDSDTARDISINAVRGAFRFITGNSPKDVYSINTPTATIGVRGTEFDLDVEEGGTTRVANLEGTTRICRRTASGEQIDCKEARDPCTLSVIRTDQPNVVQYSNTDIAFRNRQLRYYFRYIRSQEGLLPEFRAETAECLKEPPPVPLNPPGPPPNPPPGPPDPPDPPPPPTAPTIAPPAPPSIPAGRHDSRPDSDHRSVFR